MESSYPVDDYFGGEFSAICNHCWVMAAWRRQTFKSFEKFLRFFGKTTPYGKIFKILFRKFYCDTIRRVVFKFTFLHLIFLYRLYFSQFCSVGMNAMFVSLFLYCLSVCFLCFYGPCCLIQNKMKMTWNFVKFEFGRRKIGEIVRYLADKKKSKFCLALQLSLLSGSRPKPTRASPRQCIQSSPDFIQIGSLEHRQNSL